MRVSSYIIYIFAQKNREQYISLLNLSYINLMKRIIYLFLSGIVLLTACQNNPSKQTNKDVQNIDSTKQKTNIDSAQQNAKIDSVKQVLAQTTDPLKRIKLHQQIIDIKIRMHHRRSVVGSLMNLVRKYKKSWTRSMSVSSITLRTITVLE